MGKPDLFGIARETKIRKSGVREVFTPHRPVQAVELFFGRQKEVGKILEQINTPGQHALLYGERGVGKSSLANVATELLIKQVISGKLYTKRCDSSDTFETVLAPVLADFGIEVDLTSKKTVHKEHGKGGLMIPVAAAEIGSERATEKTYSVQQFSPSVVADALKDREGLLYIDEADRIATAGDKGNLAELIKLLSDNGSNFKVLVVGIAQTAEELTGGHESVQRCLKETRLPRMNADELELIVVEGAEKVGLDFDATVTKEIVKLSSGYPHFTHLLALKCAEEAVANDLTIVDRKCLESAMNLAVEDAEGTLLRQYAHAVRSYGTDMYRHVLEAAAMLDKTEFRAEELRAGVEKLTGAPITQGSLNNYLQKLVADDYSAILHRCSKGVYQFSDPRMSSYIRIANPSVFLAG